MALFNYECDEVKRKIDEVSPNYPQLTTFEKEWLFFHKYHYIPGIPVELEYETVSVNPYGMVTNAIPFAYKSAILNGNTLVNVVRDCWTGNSSTIVDTSKSNFTVTTAINQTWASMNFRIPKDNYKQNKDYIAMWDDIIGDSVPYPFVKAYDSRGGLPNSQVGLPSQVTTYGGKNFIAFNTGDCTLDINIRVHFTKTTGSEKKYTLTVKNMKVFEYQPGMENWDIPYFEGMKSVQMPDLTTIGKNLINQITFKLIGDRNISNEPINVIKGVTYTLSISNEITDSALSLTRDNISTPPIPTENKSVVQNLMPFTKTYSQVTFTAAETGNFYLHFRGHYTETADTLSHSNIQLEVGSTATSYEPFKSNILTVNEEVELRGVGEIKDELNLITGELTQRIIEIVFDKKFDNKNINVSVATFENVYRFGVYVDEQLSNDYAHISKFDKFSTNTQYEGDFEHAYYWNNTFYFFISKDKLNGNIEAFKKYITNNPITFQGVLKNESVKTVDLTKLTKPYEGTNNYHLTTNIPCKAILEVPVVSTGKQTLEEINNY